MSVAQQALDDLAPGFARPAMASQQVFRAVLEALSRPGTVQRLPGDALAGLDGATALSASAAALMLTLLDAETSVHVAAPLHSDALSAWLRFHTGVRLLAHAPLADFVLTTAAAADPARWRTLRMGSDEAPQQGATWVIEVPALSAPGQPGDGTLHCTGPGIRDVHTLKVAGLRPAFWQARADLASHFPRGIDLVLCCGDQLAVLPRTTSVETGD